MTLFRTVLLTSGLAAVLCGGAAESAQNAVSKMMALQMPTASLKESLMNSPGYSTFFPAT